MTTFWVFLIIPICFVLSLYFEPIIISFYYLGCELFFFIPSPFVFPCFSLFFNFEMIVLSLSYYLGFQSVRNISLTKYNRRGLNGEQKY